MKIGLIGAGRLGICLALLMERVGYDVIVSDIRTAYVSGLNDRRIETNEPEVEDLLKEAKEGKLVLENGTDGKPVQLQQEQKEFKGEVDLPEGMEK